MSDIILASQSPMRIELLKFISPDFRVIPADIDETVSKEVPCEQAPEFLAVKKALHVASSHSDSIVIGCDTAVFIDGEMLGKPKDEAQAHAMLKRLSGRTHTVITGCALCRKGMSVSFSESTKVTFCDMTDDEISDYIHTNEPMDKAGAYGIQGYGSVFIKGIAGDYFNVMGLPVSRLYHELKKFKSL